MLMSGARARLLELVYGGAHSSVEVYDAMVATTGLHSLLACLQCCVNALRCFEQPRLTARHGCTIVCKRHTDDCDGGGNDDDAIAVAAVWRGGHPSQKGDRP